VLVTGAGGGAGSFAVQLAKLYGAEVTGVDGPSKQEFMRSLGADHVIDYTRQDFTRNGKQYDLILDMVAYRSVFACRRALKAHGSYYAVGGSVARVLQILLLGPLTGRNRGKKISVLVVQPNARDLAHLAELCVAGKLAPVIDRCFPLREVPEALRYMGEGHPRGKIVIKVA
jgi:NADPH:quinone reductase-like Zn-dependent oxidoreductase